MRPTPVEDTRAGGDPGQDQQHAFAKDHPQYIACAPKRHMHADLAGALTDGVGEDVYADSGQGERRAPASTGLDCGTD